MACLTRSAGFRRVRAHATALALTLAAGCFLNSPAPATQSFTSMGTLASVTVASRYRNRLPGLTAGIKAEFRQLENRLSTYQDDSEVSLLSRQAGISPVRVSEVTERLLVLSKRYGEITGGAFDVTVSPVVRLWGFGGRPPLNTPEPDALSEALQSVGFHRIVVGEGTAFLPAGMSVDFGGIAKGWAVDRAFDLTRGAGVGAAMLDLGGNIRVIGQAGEDAAWTIGIRNPFERESTVGRILLPDGMAVATSGNYERFVELGGRRYSHIIDPRTGYPVEGMASVTVMAPNAMMSDALSTGLFVLGMDKGADALRQCPRAEALFIPDRNPPELWLTPGMQSVFEPLPEFAESVRLLRR